MRFDAKLAIAAVLAALALIAVAGSASAGRLSVNERSFTIRWTPSLDGAEGGELSIECPITLTGSFHGSTFAKVSRTLIGFIVSTRINRAECSGGELSTTSLPWHIRYERFAGTLPAIASVTVDVIGAQFTMTETFGQACQFRTTEANPSRLILQLERSTVSGVRADETATIPMTGPFPCELSQAHFSGTGAMQRPEGGAFSVTLI